VERRTKKSGRRGMRRWRLSRWNLQIAFVGLYRSMNVTQAAKYTPHMNKDGVNQLWPTLCV
jgi:hypothetical protein